MPVACNKLWCRLGFVKYVTTRHPCKIGYIIDIDQMFILFPSFFGTILLTTGNGKNTTPIQITKGFINKANLFWGGIHISKIYCKDVAKSLPHL